MLSGWYESKALFGFHTFNRDVFSLQISQYSVDSLSLRYINNGIYFEHLVVKLDLLSQGGKILVVHLEELVKVGVSLSLNFASLQRQIQVVQFHHKLCFWSFPVKLFNFLYVRHESLLLFKYGFYDICTVTKIQRELKEYF